MINTSVLKRLVVTEKAMRGIEGDKKVYTFSVDKKATKKNIKSTIESVYDVKVESINTLNTQGKIKMTRKGKGKRADVKKAYVTLKSGQINISESI